MALISDEEIVKLYKSGLSLEKIAKVAGHGGEWVRKRLIALGCERRKQGDYRRFNPSPDELRDLYQRMTLLQIAEHYGVGETVVWSRVKEFGIAVDGRKMGHRGLHERTRQHRETQSKAFRGKWSGEKNPHWKGGVHLQHLKERGSGEYKQWKLNALHLRGNACQKCGVTNGTMCGCCGHKISLHVHHVFPFASHPDKRYDPENSEVLCPKCHAISHGRTIG